MVHQIKRKSKSGSTTFTNTIHFEINDAKTYAASILLNNYYFERDETILKSFATRMRVISFSRSFLTQRKANTGCLICAYCKKPHLIIEFEGMKVPNNMKATIDHIDPISKGGAVFAAKNINVACGKCNGAKSDMSVEEFMQIVKPYDYVTPKKQTLAYA